MKYLLILGLACSSLIAAAQSGKRTLDFPKAITVNPLPLIQFDNTLMGGFEYRVRPKIMLAVEAGWIFHSIQMDAQGEPGNTMGFIIRPAAKFFTNPQNRVYVQAQLFYKQASKQMHDWLGRDCVDGVPAYEALQDFTFRRHVYGANAGFGVLAPTRSGKLIFDFYLGVGVRKQHNTVPDVPRSCYTRFDNAIVADDNQLLPSLPGGVRLLFPIR